VEIKENYIGDKVQYRWKTGVKKHLDELVVKKTMHYRLEYIQV
jgi:hypothetical protein